MRSKFKDEHPFGELSLSRGLPDSHIYLEKRKAEAERIRQKYPDRIPVSSALCI
jgi:GABA(A) receptor-associated protein